MPVTEEIELVRYLREVARARRDPVLDVGAYEQVAWLADLPTGVPVRVEATRGEVLFGVPASPLSPPAEPEDFDGWLDLRRWHRTLRTLAEQQGAEYELVLATGLLTWTSEDGVPFRNHLLTTPVRVVIDPATGRADVVLLDRPANVQDRALLEGLAGFEPERTSWTRDTVRTGQGYGLQESTVDVLRKWCSSAFDQPIEFIEDWPAPAPAPAGETEPGRTGESAGNRPRRGGAASMRLAPALVLRAPGRAALLDFYDAIIATLTELDRTQGTDALAPLGLARLVGRDGEPVAAGGELAHPGEMVAYIPERSPQVMADLVTALLAQGRRVLVATPGPQGRTLSALRAAVPAQIAPLCVGPAQVEDGVAILAKRFSEYDPEAHEHAVADLMSRLSMVRGIIDDLAQRIEAARAGEVYDLAPGYRGSLGEITELLREHEPACSWMPLNEDLPPQPALTAEEAAELLRLLAEQTPRRIRRTGQSLPAPETLPNADLVEALIATERSVPALTELRVRLSDADPAVLSSLRGHAASVAAGLDELRLDPDPARWDQADWAVRALHDGLAHRAEAEWNRSAESSIAIAEAEEALRLVGDHRVILPPGEDDALLQAAHLLREHLSAGNGPDGTGTVSSQAPQGKRGRRGSGSLRDARRRLKAASVDGRSAASPEALDVIIAALTVRARGRELAEHWRSAGVDLFPVSPDAPDAPDAPDGTGSGGDGSIDSRPDPLPRTDATAGLDQAVQMEQAIRRFAEARRRLEQVRTVVAAVDQAMEPLAEAGIAVDRDGPGRLLPVAVLAGLPARLSAERATAELDEFKISIEREIMRHPSTEPGAAEPAAVEAGAAEPGAAEAGATEEAPELHEAVAAIASRDPVTYGRCLVALAEAHRERADQARCEELLDRLRKVHPPLAALMTARSGDGVWKRRLELWNDAWYWAYASVAMARRPRSEMEQRLEDALGEARQNQSRHAKELMIELTWGWCMSRMSVLSAYAVLPAWVMPIWQIVESVPPVPDSFDVVVLDETAQESIEALFLLWLAPRVIVVGAGDPHPAAPVDIKPPSGPPGDVVSPDATVFSVLAARLGPVAEPGERLDSIFLDESVRTGPPPAVDLPLRPGMSIASYRRSELAELITRLAATGDGLSDEELIDQARTLLDTPPGEGLLTAARLRYTLDVMQAEVGRHLADTGRGT